MIRFIAAALVAYVLVVNRLPEIPAFFASLDQAGFTFGALTGFVVIGGGMFLLAYRFIHNRLVDADEAREIEGVRKKHGARRI